jgi:hypothetical protein
LGNSKAINTQHVNQIAEMTETFITFDFVPCFPEDRAANPFAYSEFAKNLAAWQVRLNNCPAENKPTSQPE